MAARRPLVLDESNRTRELPGGDILVGVPMQVAVGLRAGGVFNIALTSTYAMTIGLRAGGVFNVQATT
ncbi:hypothetical protein JY440_14010 [Stenotrophomonas maltophilia]|uniref:Uncharacterized protein n=1 Tax=Stenotrophomonas maltophilia TaxID=40324 RepID=A0AB34TBW1_STEMA|nr:MULTISPECIES: hypothetical protein [Stenotrophomonas]KOO70049.1 hypothetical protein VL23_20390 [Stenotrophomonas maltophilia]KOQ79696.1 hypothetical protein ABW45_01005 [Stenotrophomonas maltophilia]MBN4984285.1 hypothetical protein [Stenotrophomonas maltophilia]MDQ7300564.1 hypothetical protein [Stenotrophomonas sp. Sm2017]